MVAKSYIRLILLVILASLSYKFIYSMNNLSSEISLDKAYNLYKEKKLLIIDVRTKNEWEMTGVIPDSILINMHDNNYIERKNFLKEVNLEVLSNKNKNIAFICASGARSKVVMDFLLNQGYKNISHIPDGITGSQRNGWLFQGYPIINFLAEKEPK